MSEKAFKSLFAAALLMIVASLQAGSIPVANYSFEKPYVAPVDPYAWPVIDDWIEEDNDIFGQNTGVFVNVTGIVNTDANQVAFLGGQEGNGILQDLDAVYQVGKNYRMTVGICLSAMYPPSDPNGLRLSFYYTTPSDPNRTDITYAFTDAPSTFGFMVLQDNSINLPTVQADDAWAGKTIGIAIRATGPMGGYWDLDNVRVTEYPLVPNFTEDLFVNLEDFSVMAADWLNCVDPFTDVTGDGCVDEEDLEILILYWLENV